MKWGQTYQNICITLFIDDPMEITFDATLAVMKRVFKQYVTLIIHNTSNEQINPFLLCASDFLHHSKRPLLHIAKGNLMTETF